MKMTVAFKWVTLVLTVTVWILFICGADSLAEKGYLGMALAVVGLDTLLCWITLDEEDIKNMFKIKDDEQE